MARHGMVEAASSFGKLVTACWRQPAALSTQHEVPQAADCPSRGIDVEFMLSCASKLFRKLSLAGDEETGVRRKTGNEPRWCGAATPLVPHATCRVLRLASSNSLPTHDKKEQKS
jgi:hypothetical protein